MLYYVILTQVCGLFCRYCMNKPDPSIQPLYIDYDIDILKEFISKDREPIICFYGGDPLMAPDLIMNIMDGIKAHKYVLQTNGLNIDKLPDKYIRRLDTILISIDGREEVTDYNRGKGIYRRTLEAVRYIWDAGFKGDLVARMTVSGASSIYEDVMHLINLGDNLFTHIHWQLDVLWDIPPAQRYKNFSGWIQENYIPGLIRLIDWWVRNLEGGTVYGIAPFKALTYSMLTGYREATLWCGSGIDAFAITTDGRIIACPIAPEYRFNQVGTIFDSEPSDIHRSIEIGVPCKSCELYRYCGGRCLFSNKTMYWGLSGFREVCRTVESLINGLRAKLERIRELIDNKVISINDLKYPPYLNSVEVIP